MIPEGVNLMERNRNKRTGMVFLGLILCVLLLCAAVSCQKGEEEKEQTGPEPDKTVSSEEPIEVSLSDTSLEIGYGITRALTASGGREIHWSTSDGSVTEVDGNGNVKGTGIGECVITATNEYGKSAQCRVTVKKTCYLTFDDGPLRTAPGLLDALDENGVKATFFLCDTVYLPIVTRMHEEGHALGLHTRINSTKHCYADMFIYYTDLDILNDHIEELTGERCNMLRFPGGTSNSRSNHLTMRRIVNGASDLGYRVFDWTISTEDATENGNYENACQQVYKRCYGNQEIILMHDMPFTADVVRKVVPVIKNRGYVFETLDHYPERSYAFQCRYSRHSEDVPAVSVRIKPRDTIELKEKTGYNLQVEMKPSASTDFVVWQSSDESVVSVNKGGHITGHAPGEAVITARTTSGAAAECRVKVLPAE
jgi:Predicted xylanase/chitin deacetylase